MVYETVIVEIACFETKTESIRTITFDSASLMSANLSSQTQNEDKNFFFWVGGLFISPQATWDDKKKFLLLSKDH